MKIWVSGFAVLLSIILIGYGFDEALAGSGPDVTLTKTVNKDGSQTGVNNLQVVAGTQVTYNYLVQNTGNVILICTILEDDQSQSNPIHTFNQNVSPGGFLPLHQEQVTINADVTNEGTITCFFEGPNGLTEIQGIDTATVDVVNPSVTIDKTVFRDGQTQNDAVDNLQVTQGTDVFYVYKITNTGDVQLDFCNVSDDPDTGTIFLDFSLNPNEMNTLVSGAVQIDADVMNEATVTCADVAMFTPTDMDTANVEVVVQRTCEEIFALDG